MSEEVPEEQKQQEKSMFDNDMDMKFPVITISLSYDDAKEPVHVDLGSVQPIIAKAIFEQILDSLDNIIVSPKITLNGVVLMEAESLYESLDISFSDDDDLEDDN